MTKPVTRAEIEDARDTLSDYVYAMKCQYQPDAELIADYERVVAVLDRLAAEATDREDGSKR